MAATVVQSNAAAQNTGLATVAATWTTPATAGNTLLLIVGADDYRTTTGANRPESSGFTLSTGCAQETFLGHYVWWKVAAGGETSANYTIGSASPSCWITAEISGLEASPYDISAGQLAASFGANYTTQTITPTAGERLIIASIGGSLGAAGLTDLNTWLNSFTEIRDIATVLASGTRDIVGAASISVTANGATGYSSGATYNVGPDARTGIILAFKVAAAGGGRTVAVGQAVETDTVTAVTRRKARTVAQATEADSSTPVGRAKVRAVAQAAEADTAQPVGRLKQRTVGQPTETGLAQPTTRIKTRAIGQPGEVDTAQPVGRRKVRLLGQAVETDLAQPVGSAGNRIVAVGMAAEVDISAAMGRAKTRTVGQPVELDSALAFARLKVRTVAGVTEINAANPVTPVKARILGLAVEADTAKPLTRSKVRTIGQAVETDTATALLGAGPRVVARGTSTLTSATATVGLAATGSTARLVPRSEVRLR